MQLFGWLNIFHSFFTDGPSTAGPAYVVLSLFLRVKQYFVIIVFTSKIIVLVVKISASRGLNRFAAT